MYTDTTTTFPEFNISASSQMLNKIKPISTFMDQISLLSSYDYQKKAQKNYIPGATDYVVGETHHFSPLISVDAKLKKLPISLNYSHTYNITFDSSSTTGMTDLIEHTNKLSLSYALQSSGKKKVMNFLFWKLALAGTLTMSLNAEQGTSENDLRVGTGAEMQKTISSHYSISPSASYTFTNNITGKLSYTTSQKNDMSLQTTSNIFSLSVNVTLK